MLKNTLTSIPQIVLLRSDKILMELIGQLKEKTPTNSKKFSEILEGVKDFYPNSYRLDEIELTLSQKNLKESGIKSDIDFKKFAGSDYNYEFIEKLYKKFFKQDGAYIFAKEKSLE